jgi:hypothetical protein
MQGGRGTRRWAALVVLVVATAACSGIDSDGRPRLAESPERDLARGMFDVGTAVMYLGQESGTSLLELGGLGLDGLDGRSDLLSLRADTDEAVAEAAEVLGVEPPEEALAGLRAEIDRYIGQWDTRQPGFIAAMQPVIDGFERMADGLLDDAERAIEAVEHPRVRRGLELLVTVDRVDLRFDTLLSQLMLFQPTAEELPEHSAQVAAAWAEMDSLATEVRAEGAEPYAGVVAAEFPDELHEALRVAVDGMVATGTPPDTSALMSQLSDDDDTYQTLGFAIGDAVRDQVR